MKSANWKIFFLVAALATAGGAHAQSCQRGGEMLPQDRSALEAAAQQVFDQAARGDAAALRAGSSSLLQASFAGVAAAINDNHAALAGATAQLRASYRLESGPAAADGRFYCGVFTANGMAAGGAEFSLPGLAAGRYGIVIHDVNGSKGAYVLTTIFQDAAGWKLAGFYIHAGTAAGHDGVWFRERARDFKNRGQLHNAWLYYMTAWELLAPVSFMDTRLLTRITIEGNTTQPRDFPAADRPSTLAVNGGNYNVSEVSVFRSESNLDVVLKFPVASTADFNSTQSEAHNVAMAFGSQYPELRDAFNNVWAHAVDSKGGDVVGGINLKPPEPKTQPSASAAPLPADVDNNDPALPVWMRPGSAPARAGAQPLPSGPRTPAEVTLFVSPQDVHKNFVGGLQPQNFLIYENDRPQQVTAARLEDAPASIGIVVDNSGSMRDKRSAITRPLLKLIAGSNPQSEFFVVNFNDTAFLDQDFTNNPEMVRHALDLFNARGGIALYEAVVAASDHLAKAGKFRKKILILITDGEDNESTRSLEWTERAIAGTDGPTVYAVGIFGEGRWEQRARKALDTLVLPTGGLALFPHSLSEVEQALQQIGHDIRNQYSLTYTPAAPSAGADFRRLRVVIRAPGYNDLLVRTRAGYYTEAPK
jgi:Ca-activated chloride channel family protein